MRNLKTLCAMNDNNNEERVYYVAMQLNFLDDLQVVINNGVQKVVYPLSKIANTGAVGMIFVYESLEDLRKEFPDSDYITIKLNLPKEEQS